jgi:hypothetical protein
MDKEHARQQLMRISREHELDRDGGYALVGAIRRAREEVGPADRHVMAVALGDLVRAPDPELWGVALEALVQLGETRQVALLANELASQTLSDEWKDNVVLGLLRLGQGQFQDLVLERVRESLQSVRGLAVPLVAALFRMDREASLAMAVTFFDGAFVDGRNVEGFVPSLVRYFVAVDEAGLTELVLRLSAQRADAGKWLADNIDAYLAKPWMARELGSERVARLRGRGSLPR